MKLTTLLKLMMSGVLCLLSFANFAATGWCTADGGAKVFNVSMNKNITNPVDNYAGLTLVNAYQWNLGTTYPGRCSCTSWPETFFNITVPLALGHSSGGLNYYTINDYLEVATTVYQGGSVRNFIPTPWNNESDRYNYTAYCNQLISFATGNAGQVSIYFKRPFVGQVNIPQTKILDIYGSTISGSYSSTPVTSVYLSGSVTVPQSCNINAGQVVNVNFGNIPSENLKIQGATARDLIPRVVDMTLVCNNISEGVNVSLSVNGTATGSDPSALATSYTDIGIRIKDAIGNIISPNSGRLPVSMSYATQTGTSMMTLAPMNVTGNVPPSGPFTATATVNAELQ